MKIERSYAILGLPLTVLSLFLSGCGDADSGEDTNGNDGTPVTVVMNEWSISPNQTSAPAGKVTFVAENKGEDVHELVLLKTDLAPDKLPVNADGDVDEEGAGVTNSGEVEDVAPGKSGQFTADLVAGSYALVCNIAMPEGGMVEHHYALGMRTSFTVK